MRVAHAFYWKQMATSRAYALACRPPGIFLLFDFFEVSVLYFKQRVSYVCADFAEFVEGDAVAAGTLEVDFLKCVLYLFARICASQDCKLDSVKPVVCLSCGIGKLSRLIGIGHRLLECLSAKCKVRDDQPARSEEHTSE